jgi:hypothetical protein
VDHRRIELRTASLQVRLADLGTWQPRAPGASRTRTSRIRNPELFPLRYGGVLVGTDGVEPPSPGLQPGAMNRFSCIPEIGGAGALRTRPEMRRFAAPLIAGCAALPRSPGPARSNPTARRVQARRTRDLAQDRNGRCSFQRTCWNRRARTRACRNMGTTMAGPDGVEPPSRVLETHSSP